jgi:hypothetical protein
VHPYSLPCLVWENKKHAGIFLYAVPKHEPYRPFYEAVCDYRPEFLAVYFDSAFFVFLAFVEIF